MAIRTIPLTSGRTYQRFTITLDELSVTFRLRWLAQYEYFVVDLLNGDDPIAYGRGLHPSINLVDGLNVNLGRIYLEGDAPTVDNLGTANKLRYEELE